MSKGGRPKISDDDPVARDLRAFADRLRSARTFRGLGSRELSGLAGLSEAAVSSIETGRVYHMELATAYRLADALRVRRAWLIAGDGIPDGDAVLQK